MNLDACKVIADSRWKTLWQGGKTINELVTMLETCTGEVDALRAQLGHERDVSDTLKALQADAHSAIAVKVQQEAEIKNLRAQLEAQQRENRTLTDFSTELRQNIEDARGSIRQLQDEKHLVEVELAALQRHLEAQRIGNGKLTTFIKRRHRPDGLPERLNAITHQNFRQ